MKRAIATCWMFILLSAFFCEMVISKGGRGGARGAARGSARGTRTRVRPAMRYGSSAVRVAAAAAAGAAVGLAAGGWYASSRVRPDDSSERFDGDNPNGNSTGGDFYSARTSASTKHAASLTPLLAALCSISVWKCVSP